MSFVRALDTPDGEALMRGLIALTHALNRITVAEGVESPAQCDWLVRGGCEELQGYLLGRPLEAADVPAWLATQAAQSVLARTLGSADPVS